MVTNYPRPVVATDAPRARVAHGTDDGRATSVTTVLAWMRQTYCGLHGHDSYLQFEQDRMFMRCVSCGHETPGWALNEAPPVPAVREQTQLQPKRRPLMPHLVGARKIA